MLIFDLIRHGKENEKGFLSKEGAERTEVLAQNIIDNNYSVFLTSPHSRCKETMKIIANYCENYSFETMTWLCTRFPNDWDFIVHSKKFIENSGKFKSKLETLREITPHILFRDAKHTFSSIKNFAKEKKYSGKVLAISHSILIATTAGLFKTGNIFDSEFDNPSNLSGVRIVINENNQIKVARLALI